VYVLGWLNINFLNIGKVVVAVHQYIFPYIHIEGKSHKSVREKMTKKGSWSSPHGIMGDTTPLYYLTRDEENIGDH
jgi:hypothetical protein